jgi:hypothetical protein
LAIVKGNYRRSPGQNIFHQSARDSDTTILTVDPASGLVQQAQYVFVVDDNARLSQNLEGAAVDAFDFVLSQDAQIGPFEAYSIKTSHSLTPFGSTSPNPMLFFSAV